MRLVEPFRWQTSFVICVLHVVVCCGHGATADDGSSTPAATEMQYSAAEVRQRYTGPSDAWPAPTIDPGVAWDELGPLPEVHHPAGNPYSAAKAELGRALFFDPRLSGSREIACASCHDPDLAWADGRTVSFGHHREPLKRNAPTIRNVAFQSVLFWDGRSATIEDQVEQVLLNPAEMHIEREQLVAALEAVPAYQDQFATSFEDKAITFERVVQTVACFQRTVVGGRSRFDRFVRGEQALLTDQELHGLDLFRRKARCMNCHHGPLFADGKFHNVGLSYYGRKQEDLGRYRVTGQAEDVGRFRTPSLRDVTNTEPLMHNGLFKLSGVLNMYNAGMPTPKRHAYQQHDPLFPVKSPHLKPLGLTREERDALEAFLGTLAEPYRRIHPPAISQPAVGP